MLLTQLLPKQMIISDYVENFLKFHCDLNQLIKLIAAEFGRADLEICDFVAENAINRTLVTVDPARNLQMWRAGGYNEVPSIQEMVSKYAQWTTDID